MSEIEIIRFIQTWLIVYACLAYTFGVGKIVPPGKVRFLLILPVVSVFLLLPLRLSSTILCALTALFVTWLGFFKLALFSFGKGPLATDSTSITFARFLALGSLPIIPARKKIVANVKSSMIGWVLALKIILFTSIFKLHRFEAQLHPMINFYLYGCQVYLILEFITFGIRAVAEPLLGLELDIPFDEPLISTSMQNFLGRRWNLVMGSILRDTIYDPMRALLTPYIGNKHAQKLSVVATFVTSGIMHEIAFYYLIRKKPAWDMIWYFLLQGVIVVLETDVKRLVVMKRQLPRPVSILWTISWIVVISMTVFFPKICHCNGRVSAAEEFAPFRTILKSLGV